MIEKLQTILGKVINVTIFIELSIFSALDFRREHRGQKRIRTKKSTEEQSKKAKDMENMVFNCKTCGEAFTGNSAFRVGQGYPI